MKASKVLHFIVMNEETGQGAFAIKCGSCGGEYYAGFSFGKGDIVDNELVNSVMTSSSYDFCAHCDKPTRL